MVGDVMADVIVRALYVDLLYASKAVSLKLLVWPQESYFVASHLDFIFWKRNLNLIVDYSVDNNKWISFFLIRAEFSPFLNVREFRKD